MLTLLVIAALVILALAIGLSIRCPDFVARHD